MAGCRCDKHNVNVVRQITVRKMSVVSDNGEISWVKREFKSLAQQTWQESPASDVMHSNVTSSNKYEGTTNKKISECEEDQSAPRDLSKDNTST